MSEIVYVNGAFVDRAAAHVSVFDRGFLFADGIYEVCAVLDGKLVDNDAHLARLQRSLAEIELPSPLGHDAIVAVQRELVVRNGLSEGLVYMQVTRGAADRDFAFPEGATPTFVAFAQARRIIGAPAAETGVAAITLPDLRWARRDIKSTSLLAQVLAKQEARAAGVAEAWMVEDGMVTEGASSTAFIINARNEIVTRPLSNAILPGVTRSCVLALADEKGLSLAERPFSIAEAIAAREAFLTSASTFVMPVVSIDGKTIGDGAPGPLTRQLRKMYFAAIDAERHRETAE